MNTETQIAALLLSTAYARTCATELLDDIKAGVFGESVRAIVSSVDDTAAWTILASSLHRHGVSYRAPLGRGLMIVRKNGAVLMMRVRDDGGDLTLLDCGPLTVKVDLEDECSST